MAKTQKVQAYLVTQPNSYLGEEVNTLFLSLSYVESTTFSSYVEFLPLVSKLKNGFFNIHLIISVVWGLFLKYDFDKNI
jgi:hypothetical protein